MPDRATSRPSSGADEGRYVLPAALPPEHGESLCGLVVRNAAEHRFTNSRRLLARLKPAPNAKLTSICDCDPDSDFGTGLRCLLGLSPAAFRRMSPWTGTNTAAAVLGHSVHWALVRAAGRNLCPLCLRDSDHHRAVWFVEAMPLCAVHGVWLRTACHECGAPLTWDTRDIHRCSRYPKCAADMRDAPALPAPAVHRDTFAALHAILEGNADMPPTLPGLTPGGALTLAFLLGRESLGLGFRSEQRIPVFVGSHRERLPELMSAGWAALGGWPQGFHRMLDGLREGAASRPGTPGLQKSFGGLASRVLDWRRSEPWGPALSEEFARYAAGQDDIAATAATLRRYAPDADIRHRFVSIAEASKDLGIGSNTMAKLARNRGLFVVPPEGTGTPSRLRADVSADIRKEMGDYLLPDEARAMLGVGRRAMREIEQLGLIRRLPPKELVNEHRPYSRAEIQAFVDACRGGAPAIERDEADRRNLVAITKAAVPGRSAAAICAAIVGGRLKPVAVLRGRRGLLQARLSPPDVERAFPPSRETFSLDDLAQRGGIHRSALALWARKGILETVRTDDPDERGVRVTADAWERFTSEYVTSTMIADETGRGRTHVCQQMKSLGIPAVSGKCADGGMSSLFRRSDISPEAMESIRQAGHRHAMARGRGGMHPVPRISRAAAAVAAEWNASLTRARNLFTDCDTGRAVQVITGRRPLPTRGFMFDIGFTSLQALRQSPEPWVAFLPAEGDHFLLMPEPSVPWRNDQDGVDWNRCVTIGFDPDGVPTQHTQWARRLAAEDASPSPTRGGNPRRSDQVAAIAAEIGSRWGQTLERRRNTFRDPVSGRCLQVIVGQSPSTSPTMRVFTLWNATCERLAATPDAWVALVPSRQSAAFTLLPFNALDWRSAGADAMLTTVRFDAKGRMMDIGSAEPQDGG